MDSSRRRRIDRRWILLLGTLVVAAIALATFVVARGSELPPAAPGYVVHIGPAITPNTSADRAAAIARHYLDVQTPDIVAANAHIDPIVHSVSALRAGDATTLEPGIPTSAVAADPGRVVWVASVTGDFLDLHDLPWSSISDPYPSGNIVIDDATGEILGVYPGAPDPVPAAEVPATAGALSSARPPDGDVSLEVRMTGRIACATFPYGCTATVSVLPPDAQVPDAWRPPATDPYWVPDYSNGGTTDHFLPEPSGAVPTLAPGRNLVVVSLVGAYDTASFNPDGTLATDLLSRCTALADVTTGSQALAAVVTFTPNELDFGGTCSIEIEGR